MALSTEVMYDIEHEVTNAAMEGDHVHAIGIENVIDNLTTLQFQTLCQFRENMSDLLQPSHDDFYLLRWLKARSFNLTKAELMLRKTLKWREEINPEMILESWEPPEVLAKYYVGGIYGHTKRGEPVWYEPVGCQDVKGIYSSVKKSDVLKYKVRDCERIQKAIREQYEKTGQRVCFINVLDMEGFGMKHLWQPAIHSLSCILEVFEANYPECLRTTLVLNAPRIFPIVYNIFKRVLSEDTRNKVQILGRNWKQRLLEEIDADQLPVNWGGQATGPDGNVYCVPMGGQVPKKYYKTQLSCVDLTQFTKVTVGRGSSLELEYIVEKAGSVIRWQFVTNGTDIGFSVRLKGDKVEKAPAAERVNSHLVPEEDTMQCEQPGTYVVRFDNTYSWLKSKTVTYFIEVLAPADISSMPTSPSFVLPPPLATDH